MNSPALDNPCHTCPTTCSGKEIDGEVDCAVVATARWVCFNKRSDDMTDKANERATPLTDAVDEKRFLNNDKTGAEYYREMRTHARAIERHAEALAEALEKWNEYDWRGGASGLSLVDVRKWINDARNNYSAFKREKGLK